jgi:hypothetical protein
VIEHSVASPARQGLPYRPNVIPGTQHATERGGNVSMAVEGGINLAGGRFNAKS